MGSCHRAAARACGAQIVAVVDPDAEAAAALAGKDADAASFTDLDTCLRALSPEVVHVCAPPEAHLSLVQQAVDASCHVLVEKPVVRSRAELAEILDGAAGAGVQVVPVHQFPFQRGVREILAARESLGEIVAVSYRTSSAGGRGWSPAARRDLVADILPHAASLFWAFAPGFDAEQLDVEVDGEEAWVAGRSGGVRLEAFVTLRGRPPRNELEVVGTRASATADLFHGFAVFDRGSVSGWGKATRPLAAGARLLGTAGANGVGRLLRREFAYPGLRELVDEFYAGLEDARGAPLTEAELIAATTLVERARPSS